MASFFFSVTCSSQPTLPNGNVTCSLGDDGVTSYEDTCSLQCDDAGYELDGSNTIMCHADGSWNNTSSCVRGNAVSTSYSKPLKSSKAS